MPFVLDASVTLPWLFEDEVSEYADRVLERLRGDRAAVPAIWPLEVANALLIGERQSRLSAGDIVRVSQMVGDLAVEVIEVTAEQALGPVLGLARAQGLSAYDAAYLELAMREGLPLATEDASLQAAARRVGVALVE